ncbi:MAG: hypothetical protein IJH41_06350 [Eubacterium sp.]|nr:hypothetical protein [Eubacterium sp.]
MKTTGLYENNTYLRSCTATVLEVHDEQMSAEDDERMCRVVFDRTVFFPEGGGQSSDVGTASFTEHGEQVFKVNDVQEEHGVVYHTMSGNAPLPAPGDEMVLAIDWEHRFDNMQRHCGEHILSGAFYRLFGAINKGFHMGEDYMTIDLGFDRDVQDRLGMPHYDRVTWAMAEEAETEANMVIWLDAPVTRLHFDSRSKAEEMPLRKKLAFDEDISIVMVGDLPDPYDCVACCGTHPSSAGQVGMIKIYKIEPNKGMSRIYLECGGRAFRHYQKRLDDMYDIACDMSCGLEDLKEKYDIAQEKNGALHDRLSGMTRRVVSSEAESILASADKTSVRYYDDLGTDDILSIVKQLDRMSRTAGQSAPSIVVLVNVSEKTVILASPDGSADCGKLVKQNAPAFSGRGGGKPQMARAMFSTADDVRAFVSKVTS